MPCFQCDHGQLSLSVDRLEFLSHALRQSNAHRIRLETVAKNVLPRQLIAKYSSTGFAEN